MFLGIEIGGTKLQLGLGEGDGTIVQLWRGTVDPKLGGAGIRADILRNYAGLVRSAGLKHSDILGIGVGFGGPTDDATQSTITSHQIEGWDNFPLAGFLHENLGAPAVICNDADVAGLAEAHFGAGKGLSPIFYITVGTGIGGGLIIDGKIYRGVGRGAAEIGHVRPVYPAPSCERPLILEGYASGTALHYWRLERLNLEIFPDVPDGEFVVKRARKGEPEAIATLDAAAQALAEGICTVVKLLCPRRVIIGGGVSLMGDDLFFEPIRQYVVERGFKPFAGLTDIVPAALGEEVVVHGALALARQHFAGT